MAEEVKQKVMDVILIITMGKKDMSKGIVENCMVKPLNMHMQLLLKG